MDMRTPHRLKKLCECGPDLLGPLQPGGTKEVTPKVAMLTPSAQILCALAVLQPLQNAQEHGRPTAGISHLPWWLLIWLGTVLKATARGLLSLQGQALGWSSVTMVELSFEGSQSTGKLLSFFSASLLKRLVEVMQKP